jgi:hypothetical protein
LAQYEVLFSTDVIWVYQHSYWPSDKPLHALWFTGQCHIQLLQMCPADIKVDVRDFPNIFFSMDHSVYSTYTFPHSHDRSFTGLDLKTTPPWYLTMTPQPSAAISQKLSLCLVS